MEKTDKLQGLSKVMDSINRDKKKKYPEDVRPAIYFAGERPDLLNHGILTSGNVKVDAVLHGGFKRGTGTIFYGPPNCGKSSLAYSAIAETQKDGGVCAILHSEAAFPTESAALLGVNLEELVILQDFASGDEACDILFDLLYDRDKKIPRNFIDLLVVDSIAALVPQYVIDKMDKDGLAADTMGSHAKMITKLTSRLFGVGALGKTAIIMINQVRDKITTYGAGGYEMPGGRALKHFGHVIVRVTAPKDGILLEEKKVVGHTVHLSVEKNKAGLGGHPGEETDYRVIYNEGIDELGGYIEVAITAGIIRELSPGWYIFDFPEDVLQSIGLWEKEGPKKVRGKANMEKLVRESQTIIDLIKEAITKNVSG